VWGRRNLESKELGIQSLQGRKILLGRLLLKAGL
jgi:hypothetical protein